MNLEVDRDRLIAEIDELATISEAEPPAVTRIVFSPTDLKARAWLIARCEKAGLAVRQDAIGNIFARWNGSEPNAPAVGTGSHIDAIPNAGKYDGVVGVLGGLEAIRSLQRSGFRPKHSIELLMFTSEEPTRFGIGCLGSRLLSGTMSPDAARKLDRQRRGFARRSSPQRWIQRAARRSKTAARLLQSVCRIAHRARSTARAARKFRSVLSQTLRLRPVCEFRSKARADTRVRFSCLNAETHCALRRIDPRD